MSSCQQRWVIMNNHCNGLCAGCAMCMIDDSMKYMNDTASLNWSKVFISNYEKYKEQVSVYTMVVGNLVLVSTNGNKACRCRIWFYISRSCTGNLDYPTANWGHLQ